MNAVEQYLDRARRAGLADEVRGLAFVADRCDDPISGRPQVLVEYCDPRLTGDAPALATLRRRLRERHPGATSVLLRSAGDVRPPGPWRPRLTYIRHLGAAAVPDGTAVAVRPATPADDPRVHAWLVQAFRNAYPGHEVDPGHAGIAAIMANPARRSFIALVAGEPVGHGTVLTGERDEVTGEPFAELVDILIDPAEHRGAATAALVAAIAEAVRGRKLCGHVVHPHEPGEGRRAETVLRGLLSAGWSVDHCFWESPL
ncbi:GNAT family N-acetyltransferase [Streptomyces sp. NPDC046870]|uniref:GNAT family N-acetyltransferase n=1 Tax=Streptomyces sp. NPDC046870 TaxID=3155135 RepID=UPI0034544895